MPSLPSAEHHDLPNVGGYEDIWIIGFDPPPGWCAWRSRRRLRRPASSDAISVNRRTKLAPVKRWLRSANQGAHFAVTDSVSDLTLLLFTNGNAPRRATDAPISWSNLNPVRCRRHEAPFKSSCPRRVFTKQEMASMSQTYWMLHRHWHQLQDSDVSGPGRQPGHGRKVSTLKR